MSHALIPNFSVPLVPIHDDGDRVPFHADPILAAIEAHEEAYAVFQAVAQGGPTLRAFESMEIALEVLLGTPCATRFGGFALVRHLRWWIEAEAHHASDCEPGYSIAQAREADLTRFLGSDGVSRIGVAMPSGRLPVSVPAPRPTRIVIEAGPVPSPALVRLGRAVASAGELLTCLVLVAGGCVLTGLASLI